MKKLLKRLEKSVEQPVEDGNTLVVVELDDFRDMLKRSRKLWMARKIRIRNLANSCRGLRFYRISDNDENLFNGTERSFYEEWKQMCGNGNRSSLNTIVNGCDTEEIEINSEMLVVGASLIQWLGTNVGMAFLERALSRSGKLIVNNPIIEDAL